MNQIMEEIPTLPLEVLDVIPCKFLDVPYCSQSPAQILDIYLPQNVRSPYPVIMHFHGGAFCKGTKRDANLEPMLRGLKRGYAVVSVGYRLSGEAHFPALIYDARAAVRFIRANAEKYNLNPEKIVAWGPSAGGYIVSMLGTTQESGLFEDLTMGNENVKSNVQAVVDWCGPCGGFLEMDKAILASGIGQADHNDPSSPESRLMGFPITENPDKVDLASPLKYATSGIPPFLIQHGACDAIVPVKQSVDFAAGLQKAVKDNRVILEVVQNIGHHGDPWFEWESTSHRVLDFLDFVLKKSDVETDERA